MKKNWKGWTITIDEGELRFFLSLWISLVVEEAGKISASKVSSRKMFDPPYGRTFRGY